MSNFKDIKGDYQITAPVKEIDIPRILRENLRDGSKNYVLIVTKKQVMAFFTKKFAKRLQKLDLLLIADIQENCEYGLFNEDSNSLFKGEVLRSIGFTHGFVVDISAYDNLIDIIDNVDHIEALQDNIRFNELMSSDTIKIIAGK